MLPGESVLIVVPQRTERESKFKKLKDGALLPVVSYEVDLMTSMACLNTVHADRISVGRITCSAPRWQHTFIIH